MSEDNVSSPAHLVGSTSPVYPAEARAEEVEADVVLAIVVTARGTVADARIAKPAGFGFDEAALAFVREARFSPARHQGMRVAVRMKWTVSFRLH
jgi:vitamin B12 transporter